MSEQVSGRRLLLVHAHPDDETINNGATMARYVDAGVHVTLVTCTRGEQGEILLPRLAHLAAGRDDALGEYREAELAAAMAVLGVRDHRFLDVAGHGRPATSYRDSGMAYAEDGTVVPDRNPRPDAFALADVEEAAARLADVVREVRPQVAVTYEPGGGYGHPDHVQAHRVTMRALALAAGGTGAGGAAWRVPKVYWAVVPESAVRQERRDSEVAGANPFRLRPADGPPESMIVPDDEVTTTIDATAWLPRKVRAMRAHATQIAVDGRFFALSNGIGQRLAGVEYYRLVDGEPAGPRDAAGRETDLFAGVDLPAGI